MTLLGSGVTNAQATMAENILRAVSWNPDGSLLAVGGLIDSNPRILILDSNGQLQLQLESEISVISLAWNRDSSRLGGYMGNDQYEIWDVTNGKLLHTVSQPGPTVDYSVYWHPSLPQFATVDGKQVYIRDENTGAIIETITPSNISPIQKIDWSPEGLLVIGGGDIKPSIEIWDVSSKNKLKQISLGEAKYLATMAMSSDGQFLATGHEDGLVQVWNVNTAKQVTTLQSGSSEIVEFIEWHPNNEYLTTIGTNRNISTWRISTGETVSKIQLSTPTYLYGADLSPYGGRIAYLTKISELSSRPLSLAEPPFVQSFVDDMLQITVPVSSIEALETLTSECIETATDREAVAHLAIPSQVGTELNDFVSELEDLPTGTIAPGCVSDLLALASALQP